MAPKRPSALNDPPAASFLEEEEEEETSSGEEEEEEEEEEETLTQKRKKSTGLPSTLADEKNSVPKRPDSVVNPQAKSSSSESGPGSDSDPDIESGQNVKSITLKSKPIEENTKVKKPRSKPSASTTPARSSLKNASETTKDAKRAKKASEVNTRDGLAAEDDSKKSVDESKKLFQRLWSEEDEIAILNGMIDYTAKKGADPALDMNAFHDFIKKSLHVDVTRAQLMDKVRRLKKKYKNNTDRGKQGADPTFSKPHEQKGFELSKQIWSGEGAGVAAAMEHPKPTSGNSPKKIQRGSTSRTPASLKAELISSPDLPKENDKMDIDGRESQFGYFNVLARFNSNWRAVGMPESSLGPGLDLIEKSKRTELEERWKKLHLAELQLFVRRTELIRDQAKLILEAYKSSDK